MLKRDAIFNCHMNIEYWEIDQEINREIGLEHNKKNCRKRRTLLEIL